MYPITYEKIIYDLCSKNHINIEKIKPESIYKLSKKDSTHYIWSRRFDINTAVSCRIADNKFATYSVLQKQNIPVVPCIKLPRIDTEEYSLGDKSLLETCSSLLNIYKQIVIKPNNSYEGTDVYKCNNTKEIEMVLLQIGKKYKYMIASPYIDALAEYRLFFLNGQILFAYRKEQPCIMCDGISSVKEILLANDISLANIPADIIANFEKIYPSNHKLQLNWKFNLSQGAHCLPIDNNELYMELSKLAISAAEAINICFATVDILVDKQNNKYILEINAGVAMDQFIIQYPDGKKIATMVYEKAIKAMFDSL